MSGRRSKPALPTDQLAIAWQSASLLIGYPDAELVARAGLLRDASRLLPEEVGAPLRRVVDHVERTPLAELTAEYVETFDHRRRCCLFLTYFAHGDTRKRGLALLRFKQTYQEAGLVLADDELPDHLSVVLEFGATGDPLAAHGLLLDHRAGLELLRIALRDSGSPWSGAVEAVVATLPALRGDEREAVMRLAAEGPPDEEVGLAPFTPGEYAPAAAPTTITHLPMPAARTVQTTGGTR